MFKIVALTTLFAMTMADPPPSHGSWMGVRQRTPDNSKRTVEFDNPTTHSSPYTSGSDYERPSTPYEDPLRHHVDFSELHPGEDLLAVEDRDSEVDAISTVPFRRRAITGRTLPQTPDSSPVISDRPWVPNHRHPLWNWISPVFFKQWWKGSNVCIRREEEDEPIDGSAASSNRTEQLGRHSSIRQDIGNFPGLGVQLSACEDLDFRHTCVTRIYGPSIRRVITTNYECCPGYSLNVKEQGCRRGRFQNIAKTMEELGAREFSQLVKSVGLMEKLEKEENLTVFVPIDEAVQYFLTTAPRENNLVPVSSNEGIRRRRNIFLGNTADDDGSNAIYHGTRSTGEPQDLETLMGGDFEDDDWWRSALDQQDEFRQRTAYRHVEGEEGELKDTVLNHIVQGKMSTDDFVDEKVVFSDRDNGVLRMNTWQVAGEKVNTINCARLTSFNHGCTNGMIHLIDRMLSPVTESLADVIASDPNLSTFLTLMRRAGIYDELRDSSQHITLLAPTNDALKRLGPELLDKMHRGDPCLKRILRHHIIPISFCSSIITKEGQARNINHEILRIERDNEDQLFINGSHILTRDRVATNGVVQVLDGVLLSDNDEPLTRKLERAGLTSFLEYVRYAGISLEDFHNVTVFAPSNAAFETIPPEIRSNPERLRDILQYHIGEEERRACDFSHKQEIPTMLNSRSIRMNLYSNFPFGSQAEVTAQCGRLTKVNDLACNGIIHTVDRVLIPPDMDVAELLRTQGDFSILNRLIAENGMIDVLRAAGPITLFAPSDKAFYDLPREELESILTDRDKATKLLRNHVVSGELLCCAGILPRTWFVTKTVENLNGEHVPVSREKGQVSYGNAKVTTCDLTTSNGVIHTLNAVFKTSPRTSGANSLLTPCLSDSSRSCYHHAFYLLG